MPYGTYKVELWGFGEGTSSSSEVIVQLNISTPNDTLSGGAIVEISRINNNGMFIIYDANNYLYQNPNALKEKMQTAPDRPGFLLSGRGVSSGGTDALWGAKKHASKSVTRESAGTYTVYHSIGHTDYSAIVSVMDASRSIRWADPQTDKFTVYTYSGTTLTDANFSFAVFGNN